MNIKIQFERVAKREPFVIAWLLLGILVEVALVLIFSILALLS